jgi:flagellar biosynthesis protein FlhB
MSENAAEKTEQPSLKKLEDAAKKGQVARSAELQTLFVLGGALLALKTAGPGIMDTLLPIFRNIFSHLHTIELKPEQIPTYAANGMLLISTCLAPIALATAGAGLAAGGIQTRFRLASEAIRIDFERLNPAQGWKKIVSRQALITTFFSLVKLGVIAGICWSSFSKILHDPIFHTSIGAEDISRFMAETSLRLGNLLLLSMLVFAGTDYFIQFWHTLKDLMMTKQELKEEHKNSEGDPQMKARMRSRRPTKSQRQMLAEVPQADVVVTNPTHIAIALRYDRKSMKAPKIVAKGIRFNAQKIREIAQANQVPIIENKPLARLMFKHGRVGGEIPAEFFAAVAEILAWVYRVNRYRYYSEQNQLNYEQGQKQPGGLANTK